MKVTCYIRLVKCTQVQDHKEEKVGKGEEDYRSKEGTTNSRVGRLARN